jgi:Cellulose binding domain
LIRGDLMGHRTRAAVAVVSGMIALAATLLGTATPAAAQTSTATTTTTEATDYCTTTYTTNQWPGAALVAVSIRNISTVTVRWELLRLLFPGPVPVGQFWNATVTTSGSVVNLVPSPNTGLLAPGQSVSVGFLYYSSGYFQLPTALVTCTPV